MRNRQPRLQQLVLRAHLFESASLVGRAYATGAHRFPTILSWTANPRASKSWPTRSVRGTWTCGQRWLAALTPFFTDNERKQTGCQHRTFISPCRGKELEQRILDGNRSIEQPKKITMIFGR